MPVRFAALSVALLCAVLWAILANLIASLVGKDMPVKEWPMLALIGVTFAAFIAAYIDNRPTVQEERGRETTPEKKERGY